MQANWSPGDSFLHQSANMFVYVCFEVRGVLTLEYSTVSYLILTKSMKSIDHVSSHHFWTKPWTLSLLMPIVKSHIPEQNEIICRK